MLSIKAKSNIREVTNKIGRTDDDDEPRSEHPASSIDLNHEHIANYTVENPREKVSTQIGGRKDKLPVKKTELCENCQRELQ